VQFALTILGSSSALPTSERFPTAQLLNINERFFLIDCGEGTQIQLRKYKTRLGKINRIFLSHLHGDHVFGLFGLLSTFQLLGRKTPLHIHAPGEIINIIEFYKNNFGEDMSFKIYVYPLGFRHTKIIFKDKSVEVTSFPLKHRVPTCGFLFRETPVLLNLKKEALELYKFGIEDIGKIKKGKDITLPDGSILKNRVLTLPQWKQRSYAYCSDTGFDPSVVKYISEVDLLYHEATFAQEDEKLADDTLHSTSTQAAKIASMAKAGKLLLGHFSSRYKNLDTLLGQAREIFPESYSVNDGDVFTIERVRKEHPL